MEPDYNNNYHNSYQSEFKPNGFDDLHLDDEVYEIKSDRINPEDFYQHSQKKRYSEVSLRNMPVVLYNPCQSTCRHYVHNSRQ